MSHSPFRRTALAILAGVLLVAQTGANRGPIRQLTINPEAEVVPLFEGLAADQFDVRMSASNPYRSTVVIANKTDQPLTVALPKAAVGQHVLPQVKLPSTALPPTTLSQFNGNNGFFGQNPGGSGFGQGSTNSGAGSNVAQSVGGTFQSGGFQNAPGTGPNLFGQGFPSIPPELANNDWEQYGGLATIPPGQSILLNMKTVCLNYGRPEPMSRMTYQLIPTAAHSSDPVLAELLESYSERVDRDVMQAAAWHVANGLSWEQVNQLPDRRVPGVGARLFNPRQVDAARQLVSSATTGAQTRPQPIATPPAVAGVDRTP